MTGLRFEFRRSRTRGKHWVVWPPGKTARGTVRKNGVVMAPGVRPSHVVRFLETWIESQTKRTTSDR